MYKYGMKERGVGLGCQPINFVDYKDLENSTKYYSYVWYNRPLTDEELEKYEMELVEDRTLEQKLTDVLDNLSESQLISAWNEYCNSVSCDDDRIEDMGCINDFMCGMSPYEILQAVQGNDFNVYHSWFKCDGYGGYISTDYPSDWIEYDDMIEEIIRNDDDLYIKEIREVLDEAEEEE